MIAHTIQPYVDRFSRGRASPAPIIVADRTVAVCPLDPAAQPLDYCLRTEDIQAVERRLPNMPRDMFSGLLTAEARAELVRGFRERNTSPESFLQNGIDGLILITPDTLSEAREREAGRTVGYAAFSTPSYSADGHAFVYAHYVCGGLCGYGWYFLLERREGQWQVESVQLLWIS